MICKCGERMKCIESRYTNNTSHRRRQYECLTCHNRISSVEYQVDDLRNETERLKEDIKKSVLQAIERASMIDSRFL